MYTNQTDFINILVESSYQEQHSEPLSGEYFFAYKIQITNDGMHPVKLLRRHWLIIDANGHKREVEGEGVVGQQPIIEPGSSFQYMSGCPLATEIGLMAGFYTFENRVSMEIFEVIIPDIKLEAYFKLN